MECVSFSLKKGVNFGQTSPNQKTTHVGRVECYFYIYKLMFYYFVVNLTTTTDFYGTDFCEKVKVFPDTLLNRK